MYIFSEDNCLRRWIAKVVNHKYFEYMIILCILVSAVQLALDRPLLDPNSDLKNILFYIDFATTTIFGIESLLKIFAHGFLLNGQSSYLKNPWNAVDFIVIILSILSLTPLSNKLQIFKMFRIMRVLRLIGKNESLKVGVKALFFAIPNILNIVIIMLFFFLIFGIICVSYFKGKLFHCHSDFIAFSLLPAESEALFEDLYPYASKWDCINQGGEW